MSRGAVVEGEADPQIFDRFRGEDGGERRASACAQVRDVELVVPCLAWVEPRLRGAIRGLSGVAVDAEVVQEGGVFFLLISLVY